MSSFMLSIQISAWHMAVLSKDLEGLLGAILQEPNQVSSSRGGGGGRRGHTDNKQIYK